MGGGSHLSFCTLKKRKKEGKKTKIQTENQSPAPAARRLGWSALPDVTSRPQT